MTPATTSHPTTSHPTTSHPTTSHPTTSPTASAVPAPRPSPADDALLATWRGLLGPEPALVARCDVWVLLRDRDGDLLRLVVPVEGVSRPAAPEDVLVVVRAVAILVDEHAPGGSAALAVVRPGSAEPDEEDLRWWRMARAAARVRGLVLEPPVVAGSTDLARVPESLLQDARA